MESEDQSEMIERYLFNRMSEEERISFELLMRDDPALFEEVQIQKDLLDIASDRDFQVISPHLKKQDYSYNESLNKSTNSKKKMLLAILVIAFLILLYFVGQFLLSSQ